MKDPRGDVGENEGKREVERKRGEKTVKKTGGGR